jgi:hypothetical protein
LDFFCDAPHDFQFTFEGYLQLETLVDFNCFEGRVHIWSDNSFHNTGCLYAVWEFAKHIQVPVTVSYFSPHHGFSLCDSHFGVGKQKLRADFRLNPIQEDEDIWRVFSQLSNTTVIVLKSIPKREVPSKFFSFEKGGISKYYEFQFVPPSLARCRRDSSSKEWIKIIINM